MIAPVGYHCRSALIARMVEGSLSYVARGANQMITLEADKFTIDPDLPAGSTAVGLYLINL